MIFKQSTIMPKLTILVVALATFVVNIQILSANHIDGSEFDDNSINRGYSLRRCSSCRADECRVMGMQRFSEPRCEQFGGVGSPCRMWQEPENKTLYFPNAILECDNVYMQYCPCADSLVCDEESMTCKDSISDGYNGNQDEYRRDDLDEEEIHEAFRPYEFKFPWAVGRFH